MTYHHQARQPPSLNIAAAIAPPSAPASSVSASFAEQPQQQQHPQGSQHHHHLSSQQDLMPPSSHHQQQQQQQQHGTHMHGQYAPPYSAPAMSNSSSYYASGVTGSFPPSSAQSSMTANYAQIGVHHPVASSGTNSSNPSLPFMLSSSATSSSQHTQSQFSPASSAGYGSTTAAGGGAGSGSTYQQMSAPHSLHAFPHRFTSSMTLDGMSSGGAPSGYDLHHHVGGHGHGVGLVEGSGGLLGPHGFDANGMLPLKSKRKQVKNACVNCQKACKRCDEGRPCSRCQKYGLTATCVDSARKERKRGIKRGPYKRRATTGSQSAGYGPSSGFVSGTSGNGDSMSGHGSGGNGNGSPVLTHHQILHHQHVGQQPEYYHHQQSHLHLPPSQQSHQHQQQQQQQSMTFHGSTTTSPISPNLHESIDHDGAGSATSEMSAAMYGGHALGNGASSHGHPTVDSSPHHLTASLKNGLTVSGAPSLPMANMSYDGPLASTSSPGLYSRDAYPLHATSVAAPSTVNTASTINNASSASMMQPPSMRPSGHGSFRSEFERLSAPAGANAYATSLYSNVPTASTSNDLRQRTNVGALGSSLASGNGPPASALPSSASFSSSSMMNSSSSSSKGSNPPPMSNSLSVQQRNVTVPSLFSPSTMHSSVSSSSPPVYSSNVSMNNASMSSGNIASANNSAAIGGSGDAGGASNEHHDSVGQGHRMHSESAFATFSNGSGTSASSMHSPRTPMGLYGSSVHTSAAHGELGLLTGAQSIASPHSSPRQDNRTFGGSTAGGIGGGTGNGVADGSQAQTPSYVHHPSSSTMTSVTSLTAGAFLNPPSSSGNNGQSFMLHFPHAARYRGTSGIMASSTTSMVDTSKPRSGHEYENLPSVASYGSVACNGNSGNPISQSSNGDALLQHKSVGDLFVNKQISSPLNASLAAASVPRYQLPSPRPSPHDVRSRPTVAKLETNGSGSDVTAYGVA